MYTESQYNEISEGLKDYITYFGYSNIGADPKDLDNNQTVFFNYEES